MSSMRSFALVLPLAAGLTVLTGCGSVRVNADFDPSVDFSNYESYAWLPDPAKDGDPRGENPLVHRRVRTAIDDQLRFQGFSLTSRRPDFWVGYHFSLDRELDVGTVDRYYGYGPRWGPAVENEVYEEGTLIIDVIDARAKALVWRGVGSKRVEWSPTPVEMMRNIRLGVGDVLAEFPPGREE